MFRLSSQRRTHRLRSRETLRSRCAKGCGAGRRLGLENLEPRELLTLIAAAQFLMDQAHLGCTSHAASDLNSPIASIYTDACDGADYFKGFYAGGAMTLDANDPDAAAGRSSVRATWGTTDTYGWFEFHVAEAAPRAVVGSAHTLRFMAKGDRTGQRVHVKALFTSLPDVTADVTLTASWQDYALPLPAGVQASSLSGVQFVFDSLTPRVAGFTTLHVDEVRLDTDAFDPLRVIQSYLSDGWASSGPDYNVYPNRSFLYDNALAIKALWATGDAAAQAAAQSLADAVIATELTTLPAKGSYYNDRISGPALARDGTPRPPGTLRQTLGDNAWFGLALLDLSTHPGPKSLSYLNAARAISDWAELNLKAGPPSTLGGYRGGYDDSGAAIAWRSTEHNIDLFALNWYLSEALPAAGYADAAGTYLQRAYFAADFVMKMYDPASGKFWTGTGADDTINRDCVPLDVQLWSRPALTLSPQYATAIDWQGPITWAETNLETTDGVYSGFTFSDHSTPHRVWFEGTFTTAPTYGTMSGKWRPEGDSADRSYYNRAEKFDTYEATSAAGTDLAKLNDSPTGDDQFVAEPTWATLSGTGWSSRANNFRYASAYATGGDDTARLYDSIGDDKFTAYPTYALLADDAGNPIGYSVKATGFRFTHAFATGGGTDKAWLYDSSGDDTFAGYPTYAYLSNSTAGQRFYNRANYFDQVVASSTGGSDIARFFDSAFKDVFTFRAAPNDATMSGSGYANEALNFRYVYANATTGDDEANLFDSEANDTFTGTPTYAQLTNRPWVETTFTGLGYLPGGSGESWARGASAEGAVVVGESRNRDGTFEAFRWTQATGMVGLGVAPGGWPSTAYGVSADGSVVVGGVGADPFRWTESTGKVILPSLTTDGGLANAVSADGSVAAGYVTKQGSNRACVWTPNQELQILPDLPGGSDWTEVRGLSADGSVAVGIVSTLGFQAVQWRDGAISGLGYLPGGGSNSCATAVSHDGRVIVGYSDSDQGLWEAFRWTEATGMVGLGFLPNDRKSQATAVSADGSIVVANSADTVGHEQAFIWDQMHGRRSLRDMLTAEGLDLSAWTYLTASAISDDGRTIVGFGEHPGGRREAWVATIEPFPFLVRASGFRTTVAHSTMGGHDLANLYDSSGNDNFYGNGVSARLYDAAMAAYLLDLRSFQKVDVFGTTGTNTRTLVLPIDYALAFHGTWTGDPWP
jgi:probable HAF family extracellular repeat protein